ncbi:MAG: hypothetical protein QXF01_00480 [Candidatus Micrarchaeaceae archaeon]
MPEAFRTKNGIEYKLPNNYSEFFEGFFEGVKIRNKARNAWECGDKKNARKLYKEAAETFADCGALSVAAECFRKALMKEAARDIEEARLELLRNPD